MAKLADAIYPNVRRLVEYRCTPYLQPTVSRCAGHKHLVEVDDELLEQAQNCLPTATIKAAPDEALRIVTERGRADEAASEGLAQYMAKHPDFDRSQAW